MRFQISPGSATFLLSKLGVGPLTEKTLWVAAGKVVQFAAWLVTLAVLARRLDKDQLGLFQQGWLLIGTFTPILLLGLPQGINYFLPRLDDRQGRRTVWLSLALIASVAVPLGALFVFFPDVPAAIVGEQRLAPYAGILVFILLGNLPSYFFEPLAIFRNRQRTLMLFQTAYWTTFCAAVLIVSRSVDIRILFLAIAGLGLARTLVTLFFIQRQFGRHAAEESAPVLRPLATMAAVLAPVAILDVLSLQIDKYVVSHWLDSREFAVYFMGSIEIPFIPLIIAAVTATLIPELSHLLGKNEKEQALGILNRSMIRLAWLFFPLFGYLLFFGSIWIPLVFGEEYRSSVPVFLTFLGLVPIRVLNTHPLFMAAGLQRYLLRGRLLDLGLNFAGSIALITTPLGLLGPAVAAVAATFAHKAYQTNALMRELKIPLAEVYPWSQLLIPALLSILAAAAAWAFSQWIDHTVMRLVVGTVIYGVCIGMLFVRNLLRALK